METGVRDLLAMHGAQMLSLRFGVAVWRLGLRVSNSDSEISGLGFRPMWDFGFTFCMRSKRTEGLEAEATGQLQSQCPRRKP